MSEKESLSQAEIPQAPEPQKPILLTNGVAPETLDSNAPSGDDELPEADDSDVVELLPEVLELTEEVDESGNVKDPPMATVIGIVSYGEMRGAFNGANGDAPTEAPEVPSVPALEQSSSSNALLEMIEETKNELEQGPIKPRAWTPTEFPKIEKTAQEKLKEMQEKLDKEIFSIAGKVRDGYLKIVEGNPLAIMEISKESKEVKSASDLFLQITSPNYSPPSTQPKEDNSDSKTEDADSALVFARSFRNGIYLVLKSTITDEEALNKLEILSYLNGKPAEKNLLSILGGKHAEKLKPEKIEELYEKIKSTADFFALSQKIEGAGDKKMAEEQKIESPDKTGTNQ